MMRTYKFSDDSVDVEFIVKINAGPKTVEKLLNEYRDSDEEYNDEDWLKFLRKRGIEHEKIPIDHELYF